MDESFRIEIDTVLMERAIINVLSNAVDHSPTHGEIIFNVTKDKGKCKISIIDSGPGFTPAALKYGLERFLWMIRVEIINTIMEWGYILQILL